MMDKIMLPLIHYKGNKFKDNKKLLNTAVITKHMSAVQQGTENNSKWSKHQDFKINQTYLLLFCKDSYIPYPHK